jgi:hypothetical protein
MFVFELVGIAAASSAAVIGFSATREFVRKRLRYVEAVHNASAPFKAGGAAVLLAAPVVLLLPIVGAGTALLFGAAVFGGVVAGRRDIRKRLPGV